MSREINGRDNVSSILNWLKNLNSITPFKRAVKKLKEKNLILKVFGAANEILNDYTCGELKTGDLSGTRAYEFSYKGVYYRLSYVVYNDQNQLNILFLYFGTRENYYRELHNIIYSNNSLKKIIDKGI